MKKNILISILAIAIISSCQTMKAQVTLEHTYNNAAVQLYMVNLEIEGYKYIWQNGSTVTLYNLDHSLFKVIDLSSISNLNTILYVSEHLFNNDSLI